MLFKVFNIYIYLSSYARYLQRFFVETESGFSNENIGIGWSSSVIDEFFLVDSFLTDLMNNRQNYVMMGDYFIVKALAKNRHSTKLLADLLGLLSLSC